jgi:hypothetical protein
VQDRLDEKRIESEEQPLALRHVNLDEIEESHLNELVELAVPEIRYVDYKRTLPQSSWPTSVPSPTQEVETSSTALKRMAAPPRQ